MKNNWLSIPDAPAYEINSQLLVRNKKSLRLLKPIVKHGSFFYHVYSNDKPRRILNRSALSLRRQALAASKSNDPDKGWLPIPDFPLYEMHSRGSIRNIKTKCPIVPNEKGIVALSCGKHIFKHFSIKNLLWLVHGHVVQLKLPVPCSAENQHGKFFFDSIRQCAFFLAERLPYSPDYIHVRLCKLRLSRFADWSISYFDS